MGLSKDLSFSDEDRIENIRRVGEVSKLFVDAGTIVLAAFISPFQEERDGVRKLLADDEFIEVYIDTALDVCESLDLKGLYKKARRGDIPNFTGISSSYEAPIKAELHIETNTMNIEQCSDKVINYLKEKGFL